MKQLEKYEAFLFRYCTVNTKLNLVSKTYSFFVSKSYDAIIKNIDSKLRCKNYLVIDAEPMVVKLKRFHSVTNIVLAEPESIWTVDAGHELLKELFTELTQDQILDMQFRDKTSKEQFVEYLKKQEEIRNFTSIEC